MNVVLECEVILSKKFEAICDDGEPISIHITSVSGNKGRAIVRISCKSGVSEKDVAKIGETSLMLRVTGAADDVRSLEDDTRRVGNIVGGVPADLEAVIAMTNPRVPAGEPYKSQVPLTERVQEIITAEAVRSAATSVPATAQTPHHPAVPMAAEAPTSQPNPFVGNPDAMKLLMMALAAAGLPVPQMTAAGVPVGAPPPKSQVKDNSILTYEDLMAELNSIPNVNNMPHMPTDRKLTPKETDMIISQMPKLRRKAYLRNNLQAQLMIGDLFTTLDGSGFCLALLPGAAYDLTRVPARNILNSADLEWCFKTKKVELVNTAMYVASFKKVQKDIEDNEPSTLRIYGGAARKDPNAPSGGTAEEIASAMPDENDNPIHIGGQGPDPISMSISAEQRDEPPTNVYEENPAMQSLLGSLPREKAPLSQPHRLR